MKLLLVFVSSVLFVTSESLRFNPWQFYVSHERPKTARGGKEAFEESLRKYNTEVTYLPHMIKYTRDTVISELSINDVRNRYKGRQFNLIEGICAIHTEIIKSEQGKAHNLVDRKSIDNLFVVEVEGTLYGLLVNKLNGVWTIRPVSQIPWWYPGKKSLSPGSYVFTRK